MTRSERLLVLLDVLRQYRNPVSAGILAQKMQVSIRTIYRDIATLQAQGACIEGEAGLGFVLRSGFHLPPLMFSYDELEALVLGSRLVAALGEGALPNDARAAMAKISACLPKALADKIYSIPLHVPYEKKLATTPQVDEIIDVLRGAMREGKKIEITYSDAQGQLSRRTIWAFGIAFFAQSRIVLAHCEQRNDFRHFRTDRILACVVLQHSCPKNLASLMHEWRQMMQENCSDFILQA